MEEFIGAFSVGLNYFVLRVDVLTIFSYLKLSISKY